MHQEAVQFVGMAAGTVLGQYKEGRYFVTFFLTKITIP